RLAPGGNLQIETDSRDWYLLAVECLMENNIGFTSKTVVRFPNSVPPSLYGIIFSDSRFSGSRSTWFLDINLPTNLR
ncbi:MAG: hypothetical protein ACPLRN_03640, partial [Microgenomates group bacterium]